MHGLQLLLNSTASEMFLHKLGAVRSVDWILIIGCRPGGDWAGMYIGRNVLQFSFQTEHSRSPSYTHIFFPIAFLEEALEI